MLIIKVRIEKLKWGFCFNTQVKYKGLTSALKLLQSLTTLFDLVINFNCRVRLNHHEEPAPPFPRSLMLTSISLLHTIDVLNRLQNITTISTELKRTDDKKKQRTRTEWNTSVCYPEARQHVLLSAFIVKINRKRLWVTVYHQWEVQTQTQVYQGESLLHQVQ